MPPMRLALFTFLVAATYSSPTPMPAPAPVAAPEPGITPTLAPTQTLGWYSVGDYNSQPTYAPWTYDVYSTSYYTSSTYFRRCGVGSTCTMYTGCSSGYLVANATSSLCASDDGTSAYDCSFHILKSSIDAPSSSSWFWCDSTTLAGVTFYEKEPNQPAASTTIVVTSIQSLAGDTIAAAQSSSNSTSVSKTSPTAAPASTGKSSHTGTIAGSVVGGVVILALIAAVVYYLLRRHRGNRPSSEEKPVGVQEASFVEPSAAPWPKGPYDPPLHEAPGSGTPVGELPADTVAPREREPQEMPTAR